MIRADNEDSFPGVAHTLAAAQLPQHHSDPFDRLLVAQSQLLDIPLVSKDHAVTHYDVEVIWDL